MSDSFDTSAISAQSQNVIASLQRAFETGQPVSRDVSQASASPVAAPPVAQPVPPQFVQGTTSFIPTPSTPVTAPNQPAVNPLLAQQPNQLPTEQTQSPLNQPAVSAQPQATEQPVAPQLTDAQAAQINDHAVYSVPQPDGTTASMTGLELRQSIMRHKAFTQKTQELAEQRRQLEPVATENTQLRNQLTGLQADLRNPQAVAQYVLQTFGPQFFQQFGGQAPQGYQPQGQPQPQPGYNPEDIATLGQVQQFTAQAVEHALRSQPQPQVDVAAIEQRVREQVLGQVQQVQQQQAINAALPKILEQNPAIAAVPFWQETLRFNVLQKYPQARTAREAVQAFAAEARLLDAHVRQNWNTVNKQTLVQQQALVENNTLPPGGTPVLAQSQGPRTYVDANGKADWKNFNQDLTAWMTQRFAGR